MATRYKKNIDLDAGMVYAAMRGRFEPHCIALGMTASEAFGRAEWMKKQSKQYIHAVSLQVAVLERKGLMDDLK